MNGHWGGVFISKMQNTIKSLKFLFSFTFSKVILWTRLESLPANSGPYASCSTPLPYYMYFCIHIVLSCNNSVMITF